MGYILEIIDPRYSSWGQSGYSINGQVYDAAVSVVLGGDILKNLAVGRDYYIDIQSVDGLHIQGVCFRAPGPPNKQASVLRVY